MRIDRDRVIHMHGVAEYMYEHAIDYELDPDEMYILGYIHDIGYVYGKENHEQKGAEMLNDGYYGKFVEDHGITPSEYVKKYNINKYDIPKEMILLWEADMMVDLSGEVVGFKARLECIKNRYGEESNPYKICRETIAFLENRKVVERLSKQLGG